VLFYFWAYCGGENVAIAAAFFLCGTDTSALFIHLHGLEHVSWEYTLEAPWEEIHKFSNLIFQVCMQ
jgi:hypothetical protein